VGLYDDSCFDGSQAGRLPSCHHECSAPAVLHCIYPLPSLCTRCIKAPASCRLTASQCGASRPIHHTSERPWRLAQPAAGVLLPRASGGRRYKPAQSPAVLGGMVITSSPPLACCTCVPGMTFPGRGQLVHFLNERATNLYVQAQRVIHKRGLALRNGSVWCRPLP
jgi:hypothetical protein